MQSNALAALEAMDQEVANQILAEGCITGDRVNGLCDGETGKWCAPLPGSGPLCTGHLSVKTLRQPIYDGPSSLRVYRDGVPYRFSFILRNLCRYVKFDTFHPAVEKGLPVTRVISRVVLQNVLANAVERLAGPDVIKNGCHVVDYAEEVRLQAQSFTLGTTSLPAAQRACSTGH